MAEPLYGDVALLRPNCRYTVTLRISSEEKTFAFFSELSPFYGRVQLLRQDLGKLLADFTDAELIVVLFEESLWLQQEITERDIDTQELAPFVINNVVRYRTEERLLDRLLLEHNFESGSETRQLRDLQIQRNIRYLRPEQVLADVRVARSTWESRLFGSSGLATFVRAGNTSPFPLNGRIIS